MISVKQLMARNVTSSSQDKLGCRIICCGGALFTMALLICKFFSLATNGTELAVGLGLASVLSALLFIIGFFGHRLSFGRRADSSLSSEFRQLFYSRKAVCKSICIGLSLLTLLLGVHLLASVAFDRAHFVIAVEGWASASLAFDVLAIWIGPTGAPVQDRLEQA